MGNDKDARNRPTLETNAMAILSIFTKYTEGQFRVNRRYQRKLVWTLEEKQELIRSIKLGCPLPTIVLSEVEKDRYEIIDGMQRLNAITGYMEQKFDVDDKYFDAVQLPIAKEKIEEEGQRIEEEKVIDKKSVSQILDFLIPVSTLRNAQPKHIHEVFMRINSYGRMLSDQDRRQAGIVNEFTDMVRKLGNVLRSETQEDVAELDDIPEVKFHHDLQDMPKVSVSSKRMQMQPRYSIRAEDTFWVRHGILFATQLRDSVDEECLADILSAALLGDLQGRERVDLDALYKKGDKEQRLLNALQAYGPDRLMKEMLYCFSEIDKVASESRVKLQRLIYFGENGTAKNSNHFVNFFGILAYSFFKELICENRKITDYRSVVEKLDLIGKNLAGDRSTTNQEVRRKASDTVCGALRRCTVSLEEGEKRFLEEPGVALEGIIRRHQVEGTRIEFKQGILSLGKSREIDENIFDKVFRTICAIANNLPKKTDNDIAGHVIIGIADSKEDAARIEDLDHIERISIGDKFLVGIDREFSWLGCDKEQYLWKWREKVTNSVFSEDLQNRILDGMKFCSIRGRTVLLFEVPALSTPSTYNNEIFVRTGDQTMPINPAEQIAWMNRWYKN